MHLDVEPKATEWLSETAILQQTAFWARLKENFGWESKAFDLECSFEKRNSNLQVKSKLSGDLLIMLRYVAADLCIAYVPYGPEMLPFKGEDGIWLERLSEELRPHLPSGCFLIRYDLDWESPWLKEESRYDSNGKWLGPPDVSVREMRINIGTKGWNLRKAPSDILPSNTIMVDLKQSEEQILRNMKSKTRYNIYLSARRDVKVREAGLDELPVWYSLYEETAQRNGIVLDSIDYFKQVLTTTADDTASPAQIKLLLAEKQGRPLAGLFWASSGGRATYLYGASASRGRESMPTYALQWAAIKLARKNSCKEYDMFGVSRNADPAHPMYGLYRFKTGFGGRLFHRQGCWDYPFDAEVYDRFRAKEMVSQGYHIR